MLKQPLVNTQNLVETEKKIEQRLPVPLHIIAVRMRLHGGGDDRPSAGLYRTLPAKDRRKNAAALTPPPQPHTWSSAPQRSHSLLTPSTGRYVWLKKQLTLFRSVVF